MNTNKLRRRLLKDKKYKELSKRRDTCFELSNKILDLRIKRGITVAQMSKLTGLSQRSINYAESTGEVTIKFIEQMCEKLGKKFIFYFK
jgi:DNA-binding XRE family transcriptional regulator